MLYTYFKEGSIIKKHILTQENGNIGFTFINIKILGRQISLQIHSHWNFKQSFGYVYLLSNWYLTYIFNMIKWKTNKTYVTFILTNVKYSIKDIDQNLSR